MAGRWLDPQALFGLTGLSVITHGTLFSLGANLLVHGGLAALRMRPRLAIDGRAAPAAGQDGGRRALRDLVSRFVGTDRAEAVLGNDDDRPVDPLTARNAERLLVEVVGAASARALMASALSGSALTLAEVARLLDSGGASLQFSRELLAATLEHIDPGVSVIDRDLNLVAWNSRYLDLFDYPPGMVRVGAPVADLIRHNAMRGECGPGEVEAHVERRLVYMRRGSPHSFERVRPNGRVIKTVGGAMPGGGYVMCFTDVTAEAEAREAVEAARLTLERRVEDRTRQLTSANAALAAATAEKTRFLAAASHDLLQPLHAARLLCAAADRQVEDGVRPVIGNIARAIEAADETLRTLLDISKLDSGGITPTLENVPLDPLLADLAANFRPLVTERGLALCVVPTSIIVRTDRVLLRSIVQNFLSNAVRYTKSGGIVVGVRRRGTGMADICVYDSGPGIARSDIARLFREFERGRATTEAGVGLGLAIVERTARLLGLGTIVHSEPGRGSCFGVRIAIHATNGTAPQPAPPPPLTPLATLSSPHHPRLLVVDDDPAILAAMQQWGGGLGLNVTTFSCADAVLADSPPYDAALIDLNIGPGLDGLHLAERLRAAHPTARLALISADRSAEISARAARLAIPVFPKPVDPARIEAWLLA
jgi:signal transduction histidine kinase